MRGVLQRSKKRFVEGECAFGGIQPSAGLFCERGVLRASETGPPAVSAQQFQETASWLSLATRSNVSAELLMRY